MSWMERFLARFRELLTERARDGDLTADDLDTAMRTARAHVGGLARGEKQRADREAVAGEAHAASEGDHTNGWLLLAGPLEFSEDGRTGRVQIFPPCGTYNHPSYGKLAVTPEFLAAVKQNFDAKVYQQELPLTIDLEHQTSLSGAAGWIKDIEIREGDGGADAVIEFNDRGQALVAADAYRYFSPEYYDSWQDPASGQTYASVLVGGALTNRPFFKGMAPVMVASEGLYAFTELGSADGSADNREAAEMPMDPMAGMAEMMAMMGKMAGMMPADKRPEADAMMAKAKDMMAKARQKPMAEREASESETTDEQPHESTTVGGTVMGMTEAEARRLTELETQHKTLTERLVAEETARKAAEESAKAATEKAAKLERDSNRRALTEEVEAHRAGWIGEVAPIVDRLEGLQAKLSEQEFTDYLTERRELAKRLAESDLLRQRSGAGVQVAGIQAEWDAAVRKVMSERQVNESEATAIVAGEQPALYRRLDQDHKARSRRGGD